MKEIYLCLDVGGTQIKAGAVDREGNPAGELLYFPVRAKEEREELLHHFVSVLEEIRIPGDKTAGVRLAFPGPFDYERGICLMQGLDKYDRLCKVNLRQEFTERLGMAPERVHMGDRMAKACFLVFGCQVRDALVPILEGFQPEVLCFGGQITRSGHLFLPPVEEYCRGAGIRILVTEDTSLRTLQGLTRI